MALWLGFIWIFIDKDRSAESSNIQAGRRGWHDMKVWSKVVVKRNFLAIGLLTAVIFMPVNAADNLAFVLIFPL